MYYKTQAFKKVAKLNKRIRIVQGGTSASKTVSILLWLIALAQSDKKPTLTSIVSESFPHLRRGAMRDFLLILQEHGYFKDSLWDKTNSVYTFETGSQIEFFSVDQPEKVRGARRDRLFINEANNIPFSAFEELEVRTKDFIFLDYNPTSEFWVFTELIGQREDVEHIKLNYLDNEALGEEIKKSIESRKGRPGWWQVFGLGELGEVEGKIYSGWKIIDVIPHEARLERYGIDFGYFPDPAAIIGLYYYNGGYIVDEVAYTTNLTNSQIASIFLNIPRALIIADSAEPKSIEEIKGFGLQVVPCDKGRDSVGHGINIVRQFPISVTKQSTNVIREYRNYLWETDKNGNIIPGVPEHTFSHSMDSLRYAISSVVPVKRREDFIASLPKYPRNPQKNPAV